MTHPSANPLRFFFVDVFAAEPLNGNPLAVVANADALSFEAMQKIAREFNQAETTFLQKPSSAEADARLRSFTADGTEIFGAGHNALGAWWWLAESGALPLDRKQHFIQEIGERRLPVEIIMDNGRVASVAMTQANPEYGPIVTDQDDIAAALGLSRDELDLASIPAQVVSTGAAHLMVCVRDKETVDKTAPFSRELFAILQSVGAGGCYVFSRDARHGDADVYARFFNPTVGIFEDPATGSAAGCLAAHLSGLGLAKEGTLLIEQGTAMGRTSLIRVRTSASGPQVSGRGVTVAEGVLHL